MTDLRLAEPLCALSQMTDLGMGQSAGSALHTCLLATELARRLGLPEREVSDVYYTALLQHIGCTAYSHETAALVGGDDIGFRSAGARADDENLRDLLTFLLAGIASGAPLLTRARAMLSVIRAGPSLAHALYAASCEVAVRTSDRLGLSPGVQRGLDTLYTRWNGTGVPGIAGEEIALPSRFAQVAGQAIVFRDIGGPDAAIQSIRKRAGTAFDPVIAEAFLRHGRDLMADIDEVDSFVAALDCEPEPRQRVPASRLDGIARAFADITDPVSPWFHSHSAGVATLADATARHLSLSDREITTIRLAGYLHDLGRVGVASGIWNKPKPLTSAEWERVRLHPYYSERILARSPALASLAPLAGMHHERLDGSGYHRGASGNDIPLGARVLAVVDTWDTRTHDRPHRSAEAPDAVARGLQRDATHGRLDPAIVDAACSVTGQPVPQRRRSWPAGLTDREVQVLQLAARGYSNREIGAILSISPKTADHHIQHIYDKIGVSTRAGAALFAMEHDLITTPIIEK